MKLSSNMKRFFVFGLFLCISLVFMTSCSFFDGKTEYENVANLEERTVELKDNSITITITRVNVEEDSVFSPFSFGDGSDMAYIKTVSYSGEYEENGDGTFSAVFSDIKIGLHFEGKGASREKSRLLSEIETALKKDFSSDEKKIFSFFRDVLKKNGSLLTVPTLFEGQAPQASAVFRFAEDGKTVKLISFRDAFVVNEFNTTTQYDENENVVGLIVCDKSGNQVRKSASKYDEKGHLTETTEYDKTGNQVSKVEYVYYESGSLKKESHYDQSGVLTLENEYFESGKIHFETVFDFIEDNKPARRVMEYYESGNRASIIDYFANGDVFNAILYYENGNTKECRSYENGRLTLLMSMMKTAVREAFSMMRTVLFVRSLSPLKKGFL